MPRRFPETALLASDALWTEACEGARDAKPQGGDSRAGATANQGSKTPHYLLIGSLPPITMLPFMNPAIAVCAVLKWPRQTRGVLTRSCGENRPRDSVTILLPSGRGTCTLDNT